ncbi:Ger(x)C family spore germination protein [Cohnella terricola]|uniref:Ger(X)C family spore germination protein n=1 Tax=Cohnella terricola TaxID=1289167 RepID=A0A559JGR3_9BACL|nr:Ger(x)C family spore germination protein [Cohnella terricola]TVX99059.1 Ger(x)C family spore germination protein [Cohnella terricola]
MSVRWRRTSLIVLLLLLMTGCWDRRELNEQALIFAWGMDLNDDGSYQATAQFAIPHKMGSNSGGAGRAFFTISGNGGSIYEAAKDIQLKVSRAWFAGHRRAILIGERLAKSGLAPILDEYSRNPIVRLRTDILVVKGISVADFLALSYPLEQLSASAFFRIHQASDLNPDLTMRDFLMAHASEEDCPVLPVVTAQAKPLSDEDKQSGAGLRLWGTAIFDKDARLVGNLPQKKAHTVYWIKGQLGSTIRPVKIPGEENEIITELNRLSAKIKTTVENGDILIGIQLGGYGILRENNTQLDLSRSQKIIMVQNYLNEQTADEVKGVIQEIQALGTDVLGFGLAVHRQHPQEWRTLKKDWPRHFRKARVEVEVKARLEETGMTGSSLVLKKNELRP